MQCENENQQAVPTATAATSPPTPATGSAEVADKKAPTEPVRTGPDYWIASIKRWLIMAYLHDLREFYAGDSNRFGRMVDGRGSGMSSPASYRANIAECLAHPGLDDFFPLLREQVAQALDRPA